MSLELIIGCMYSGKTSELIRRVKRLQTIQQTYVIYNSFIDARYGSSGIYTHDDSHIQAKMTNTLLPQLRTEEFKLANTIFIDEGQFFTDLYEFVKLSVETFHKNVIVIGLDGDSDRKNFGQIHLLIPLSDDITKLKSLCSICKNGTSGIFSKKITHTSNEQIDVGSINKYISVCRSCYLK